MSSSLKESQENSSFPSLYRIGNDDFSALPIEDPSLVHATQLAHTHEKQIVEQYTLRNDAGLEIDVLNYGGTITAIRHPNQSGKPVDIALGFDSLAEYKASSAYFGAIIGRYANRIASGRFSINGTTYQLATNEDVNHLHGGIRGFDKRIWHAQPMRTRYGPTLKLTYNSADGEEGYPGRVEVLVRYIVTNQNELIVDYEAATTKPTVLNLTQHTYFNLAGHDAGNILDHELQLNAKQFTPVDDALIPTGDRRSVSETPFDFTRSTRIGARIGSNYRQLERGGGYDHNYVLPSGEDQHRVKYAALVRDPASGRSLTLYTSEPGLQFYSGNLIKDNTLGKNSAVYRSRSGFALEPQHFPNSPNEPSFTSPFVHPGETYRSRSIYKFGTDKN